MDNNKDDQIPLQEVIYKPTTHDGILTPETKKSTNPFVYFSASIANLIALTCGVGFGWTSPVLPKLSREDEMKNNPLGRVITASEESWIAGLIMLGAIFGPLIAATIADRIGRKKTLLFASFPMFFSLLLTAFGNTLIHFYIARFLIGIGIGISFSVLPIYLSEISEDHNRGTLGCSLGAFIASGLLFSFSVGPYLTIRNFSLICALPLLIFMPVFIIWIPESPQFLASSNKNDQLKESLMKLRSVNFEEIQKEITQITKTVFEENRNKAKVCDLLKFKNLRKALIITIGLILLQQFSGINAVLAYMQTIFQSTDGLAPEVATIIIGVIQLLATISTSLLVDRLGRRILLVTSSFGSCLSLIALGLYFYLKENKFKVDGISFLPVTSLVIFMIVFNIGLGPLPWAVMGELFPSNVRSAASSFVSCICFSAGFLITVFFPHLISTFGMGFSFWAFALMCLAGTIFIHCILPETKGKSIQEIQDILKGKKS